MCNNIKKLLDKQDWILTKTQENEIITALNDCDIKLLSDPQKEDLKDRFSAIRVTSKCDNVDSISPSLNQAIQNFLDAI